MNKDTFEVINDIVSKWDQQIIPEKYVPYKEGDYIIVYGACSGVAIYPYGNHLGYVFLSEDDEHYFCQDKNANKAVFWMEDDIKCLQVAMKYLEEHASPLYFSGCEGNPKCQCGWQLPWKN